MSPVFLTDPSRLDEVEVAGRLDGELALRGRWDGRPGWSRSAEGQGRLRLREGRVVGSTVLVEIAAKAPLVLNNAVHNAVTAVTGQGGSPGEVVGGLARRGLVFGTLESPVRVTEGRVSLAPDLKVIAPERLGDVDYLKRFRREVHAAALLNHPNIVAVYATDLSGPWPYLAMEYVDGIDLNRLVQHAGPLGFLESCVYVRQAAHGLQHAFERGLVLCRERHPVFKDDTVEENLRAGGHLRSRDETAQGIDFALEIFPPLTKLRRRRAGLMSGGEQQMLAIGMALVARPKLLLLDEPLLGLSPVMQQAVVSAVRRITQEGVTVLVTEQYARPLLPLVDRAYVLENGTVNVSGTRDELVASPEFAAAYFGAH